MQQVTCPVCSTPILLLPDPSGREKCLSCGVEWTYLPEPIDSAELYRDEVYAVVDNRKSVFERIIFYEGKSILRRATKIRPAAKKLIDFGSGKGLFLAVAKAMDWEGNGIETEPARADFARKNYGVEVICEYYQKGKLSKNRVDLITLNHVLEHLPQPIHLLKELLESNLNPNGLLYLEVPRADSWQAGIAGNLWMHWDIPKHLSHWTEPVLVRQMDLLGYCVLGKRRFSFHLGVLGMLQALLATMGFRDNLILRLKKNKSAGLVLLIGITLPFALLLEVLSVGFDKSGILGLYFCRKDARAE